MKQKNLIFIMVAMLALAASGCSPSFEPPQKDDAKTQITEEAEEVTPPQRGLVSSYDSLRGKKEEEPSYKIFTIKNTSPDKVVDTLTRAIPSIIAVRNGDSNTIIVRGLADEIAEAQKMIWALDKKIPQILIEGKVVEVTESGMSDIGIVWGQDEGSFKFTIGKDGCVSRSDDIIATLNALVSEGKANVLANPKIAALDGKEAEINIGSRIPYAVPAGTASTTGQWTVEYIDAGVNLKIMPNIAADGTIVASIKPEVSSVSEWRSTSAGEFPVISTRNASVTVRMKDGETLVIGGLINESDRENVSGVPVLSDIPVIGEAFHSRTTEKTKTDVVFLITPHLMD